MSSSVQFDSGKTRMLSPFALRALYSRHSSGRWCLGSQPWLVERNEKMRSLARAFSSSRRAPPNAASKPWSVNACFNPSVFHISRSEEHTSELQSLMRISYAVFCLKKKKHKHKTNYSILQTTTYN